MTPLVRSPAVAGLFYPHDARTLTDTVGRLLGSAPPSAPGELVPKAIIVPHAGYVYSGPVAATAYARIKSGRGRVQVVVILGPAHTVPLRNMAVSSAQAFSTPLGVLEVDVATRDALVGDGLVSVSDLAHAAEHSLEVQLPFVQCLLGSVKVLPIVVGATPTSAVAELLSRVWGGSETLLVVSTDLSHYHDCETARRLDLRTAEAILACDPERVTPDDACGMYALRGLLAAAAERGMRVELLDLRNSADTVGDAARVVGYGAFALM